MKYYAGLDLSMDETQVWILDETGADAPRQAVRFISAAPTHRHAAVPNRPS